MSTIAAGTSLTTGLVSTSDTTGTLVLQTNGTTTAVTIGTDQNVVFNSTGAATLSKGTTGQRPGSPVAGMIRYNTTTGGFEGYTSAWGGIGGGATGAGGDQVFVQNQPTVTTSYTLTTGFNASSVGPITINNGVTVTVPSGQRWVIL